MIILYFKFNSIELIDIQENLEIRRSTIRGSDIVRESSTRNKTTGGSLEIDTEWFDRASYESDSIIRGNLAGVSNLFLFLHVRNARSEMRFAADCCLRARFLNRSFEDVYAKASGHTPCETRLPSFHFQISRSKKQIRPLFQHLNGAAQVNREAKLGNLKLGLSTWSAI